MIQHWIILQTVDRRETTYRPRILRTLRRRSSDAEDWRSARGVGTENDGKRRWSSTNTLGDCRELLCQRQGLSHTNGHRRSLTGCYVGSRRQYGEVQGRVQYQ